MGDNGGLGPTQAARHLEVIALRMEEVNESAVARARRIDAQYGEVFRRLEYVSGKYLDEYRALSAANTTISETNRIRNQALSLAGKLKRWAAIRARFGKPDLMVRFERRDTAGLVKALGHRNEDVRVRAVRLLGELGDATAVDDLIASLADPAVSTAAMTSLGQIGDQRAVEPLIAVVRREGKAAPGAAVEALGSIGDHRATEVLLEHLETGWLKNGTAHALGQLGDERAVEPMRALLARLQSKIAESVHSDASQRVMQLDCRAIENALREIDQRSGDEGTRPPSGM